MSWLDDIENAVEDALSDVVSAIAAAVRAGETIAGTVIDVAGAPLKYVIDGVAYEIGDLTGIHMRRLNPAECNVLRGVFGASLPVDKIYVTTITGLGGRPFTVPGNMLMFLPLLVPGVAGIGILVALVGLIEHFQDKYFINIGTVGSLYPAPFDTLKGELPGSTLVHESTHVWQGIHSAFSWLYVLNSLLFQLKCGDAAYDVDEKNLHTFNSYQVEQQAVLVENWYNGGSKQSDPNYPFIRDNIRPGRPSAVTNFPPKTIVKPRPGQVGQVFNSGGNRAAV